MPTSPSKKAKNKKAKQQQQQQQQQQQRGEEPRKKDGQNEPSRSYSACAAAGPGDGERYDQQAVSLALQLCKLVYTKAAQEGQPEPPSSSNWLGLTPDMKKEAQRRLFPTLIHLEYMEAIVLMRRLWEEPERDYQYLALDLLKHATVTILRSSHHHSLMQLLKFFITSKPSKDTVDELATKHLTALAYLEPAETWPRMDEWLEDPSPWVQRAVLLHQHGLGDFTDRVRFFRHCERHLHPSGENVEVVEEALEEALRRFADTYHVGKAPSGAIFVLDFIKKNKDAMSASVCKRLQSLATALTRRLRAQ